MKKVFSALLILLIISSCSSGNEKLGDNSRSVSSVSSRDIIGTWSNLSMKITYLDLDSVYEVPEGQWEDILKIKPIVTTYDSDSSFSSIYYGLDGKELFTSSGSWFVQKDSLYLESNGQTTSYQLSIEDKVGRFVGILDWNEDGIRRELYEGRQQKH